jgi:hypothetical protein
MRTECVSDKMAKTLADRFGILVEVLKTWGCRVVSTDGFIILGFRRLTITLRQIAGTS